MIDMDKTEREEKGFTSGYGLKECPFCGGDASMISVATETHQLYYAMCMGCRNRTGRYDTKRKAVTAWNIRVQI